MNNHLSRFLEEKGNAYLSGSITSLITSKSTDMLMNGFNSLFQKGRAMQLVDYIAKRSLTIHEISDVMRDLTFCLYFEYIGDAQYKVSQNFVSPLLSGFKYLISGKQFVDGCVEPIYEKYREATRKINTSLIYIISKLVSNNVITDDDALYLDKTYLLPTHVDYEEMIFNKFFNNLTFINTLRQYDRDELNKYFSKTYPEITGMCKPCNGDKYKSYIHFLKKDNVLEGVRGFYESKKHF